MAINDPGRGLDDRQVDDDALWYKDAIIYELHVRAFYDSNGDGIGDFRGLIEKLDYLKDLGVTCIWVLPFFPSPLKDDGYDIADYHDVHPTLGTLVDFETFVVEAHRRGLRVMTELVMNHTSDQHPWFQAARSSRESPYRDYYVWCDTDERYPDARIIFTDTERSNWTWDHEAGQYFWHRFFSHQPDLNFDNPEVRRAMIESLRFWLDRGVDGIRLDAVPYLFEREGTNCENLPETHDYLKEVRAAIDASYQGRILLAEANQWPADVRAVLRRRRRVPHGVPLPADAAHLHGDPPRGAQADRRDPGPDAGSAAEEPVGDLPAQPRRADAGDGDRRRARLHVPRVRPRPDDADQRRHPAAAGPADGERPPPDGAAERPAALDARARRSSTTATRSAWATTSTWATATACARRCSGAATATPASRAPTPPASTAR